MTKKLQIPNIFVLFLLLMLFNMAMAPSADVLLSPTSTFVRLKPEVTATRSIKPRSTPTVSQQPVKEVTKTRPASASLAMQAGNSDWIVLIGILIVVIITIPLLLKYKEWRAN